MNVIDAVFQFIRDLYAYIVAAAASAIGSPVVVVVLVAVLAAVAGRAIVRARRASR